MTTGTEPHLELLRRLRERIKETVFDEDCPPRDLAALTRRLQDISREIEAHEERLRLEGGNGSTHYGPKKRVRHQHPFDSV